MYAARRTSELYTTVPQVRMLAAMQAREGKLSLVSEKETRGCVYSLNVFQVRFFMRMVFMSPPILSPPRSAPGSRSRSRSDWMNCAHPD